MRIRDAREADIAGLLELETAAFTADRLSRRSLRRFVAGGSACLRVAGTAGAVDGYHLLTFRRGSAVARLYSIAVAADKRGAGLASDLLADAERMAARRGCQCLRLEVRADNRSAIRLYERAGYRRIGVYPQYYADKANAVRYEKSLAGAKRR